MSEGEGGAAAPAEGGAEASTASAAPASWYGDGLDEKTVGMLESKGWTGEDGPLRVLESYQHLNKQFTQMQGSPEQFVKMPSDWENEAEVQEFRTKLGVPESVDGYEMKFQDGDEHGPELVNMAHKWGMNKDQVSNLFNYLGEKSQAMEAAADEKYAAASSEEFEQFKRDSGKAFDQRLDFAKAAARELGWDEETLDQVERIVGTYKVMDTFAKLGAKFSEASSVGLGAENGTGQFQMTPSQARYEIEQLKADPQWRSDYLTPDAPGHKAAKAKVERLYKFIE